MFEYARKYLFYVLILALISGFFIFVSGYGCKEIDLNSPQIDDLREGETAYFNRIGNISEDASEIEYSSIILFRTPDKLRKHYVCRLIGKPGDKISIIDGKLNRNGVEVFEDYLGGKRKKYNLHEFIVPSKTLYLLADRTYIDDNDSRKFGAIPYTHIVGTVRNTKE